MNIDQIYDELYPYKYFSKKGNSFETSITKNKFKEKQNINTSHLSKQQRDRKEKYKVRSNSNTPIRHNLDRIQTLTIQSTGEKFLLSSEYADDLSINKTLARGLSGTEQLESLIHPYEYDENRGYTIKELLFENLLERLRPKYNSLLPTYFTADDNINSSPHSMIDFNRNYQKAIAIIGGNTGIKETINNNTNINTSNIVEEPKINEQDLFNTVATIEDTLKLPIMSTLSITSPQLIMNSAKEIDENIDKPNQQFNWKKYDDYKNDIYFYSNDEQIKIDSSLLDQLDSYMPYNEAISKSTEKKKVDTINEITVTTELIGEKQFDENSYKDYLSLSYKQENYTPKVIKTLEQIQILNQEVMVDKNNNLQIANIEFDSHINYLIQPEEQSTITYDHAKYDNPIDLYNDYPDPYIASADIDIIYDTNNVTDGQTAIINAIVEQYKHNKNAKSIKNGIAGKTNIFHSASNVSSSENNIASKTEQTSRSNSIDDESKINKHKQYNGTKSSNDIDKNETDIEELKSLDEVPYSKLISQIFSKKNGENNATVNKIILKHHSDWLRSRVYKKFELITNSIYNTQNPIIFLLYLSQIYNLPDKLEAMLDNYIVHITPKNIPIYNCKITNSTIIKSVLPLYTLRLKTKKELYDKQDTLYPVFFYEYKLNDTSNVLTLIKYIISSHVIWSHYALIKNGKENGKFAYIVLHEFGILIYDVLKPMLDQSSHNVNIKSILYLSTYNKLQCAMEPSSKLKEGIIILKKNSSMLKRLFNKGYSKLITLSKLIINLVIELDSDKVGYSFNGTIWFIDAVDANIFIKAIVDKLIQYKLKFYFSEYYGKTYDLYTNIYYPYFFDFEQISYPCPNIDKLLKYFANNSLIFTKGLNKLDLSFANLKNAQIYDLILLINHYDLSIDTLNLSNNPSLIADKLFTMLLQTKINKVDVSHCSIGDTAELAECLVDYIIKNKFNTEINLSNNQLGENFVTAFVTTFEQRKTHFEEGEKNNQLKIFLANNLFTDEMIELLLQFANSTLKQYIRIIIIYPNMNVTVTKLKEQIREYKNIIFPPQIMQTVANVESWQKTNFIEKLLYSSYSLVMPLCSNINRIKISCRLFPKYFLSNWLSIIVNREVACLELYKCTGDFFLFYKESRVKVIHSLSFIACDLLQDSLNDSLNIYKNKLQHIVENNFLNYIYTIVTRFNCSHIDLSLINFSVIDKQIFAIFFYHLIKNKKIKYINFTKCELDNEHILKLIELIQSDSTVIEKYSNDAKINLNNLRIGKITSTSLQCNLIQNYWANGAYSYDGYILECLVLNLNNIDNVNLLLELKQILKNYCTGFKLISNINTSTVASSIPDHRVVLKTNPEAHELPLFNFYDELTKFDLDQKQLYKNLYQSKKQIITEELENLVQNDYIQRLKRDYFLNVQYINRALKSINETNASAYSINEPILLNRFQTKLDINKSKIKIETNEGLNTYYEFYCYMADTYRFFEERLKNGEFVIIPYLLKDILEYLNNNKTFDTYQTFSDYAISFIINNNRNIIFATNVVFNIYIYEELFKIITGTTSQMYNDFLSLNISLNDYQKNVAKLLKLCKTIIVHGMYLYNCSIGDEDLVDMAVASNFFKVNLHILDLSVNFISISNKIIKEAIVTIAINHRISLLILDCNCLHDNMLIADLIVNLAILSQVKLLSLRNNKLGISFVSRILYYYSQYQTISNYYKSLTKLGTGTKKIDGGSMNSKGIDTSLKPKHNSPLSKLERNPSNIYNNIVNNQLDNNIEGMKINTSSEGNKNFVGNKLEKDFIDAKLKSIRANINNKDAIYQDGFRQLEENGILNNINTHIDSLFDSNIEFFNTLLEYSNIDLLNTGQNSTMNSNSISLKQFILHDLANFHRYLENNNKDILEKVKEKEMEQPSVQGTSHNDAKLQLDDDQSELLELQTINLPTLIDALNDTQSNDALPDTSLKVNSEQIQGKSIIKAEQYPVLHNKELESKYGMPNIYNNKQTMINRDINNDGTMQNNNNTSFNFNNFEENIDNIQSININQTYSIKNGAKYTNENFLQNHKNQNSKDNNILNQNYQNDDKKRNKSMAEDLHNEKNKLFNSDTVNTTKRITINDLEYVVPIKTAETLFLYKLNPKSSNFKFIRRCNKSNEFKCNLEILDIRNNIIPKNLLYKLCKALILFIPSLKEIRIANNSSTIDDKTDKIDIDDYNDEIFDQNMFKNIVTEEDFPYESAYNCNLTIKLIPE